MKKQQKVFFIKICFYTFFVTLMFENSLWMIYLTNLGYSLSQIATLQITFSVALLFSEYLSGILADKFGRKKMLIIANIGIFTYALLMIFAFKIILLFIAFLIYAFSLALASGTSEALLYDNLDKENKKKYIKLSSIIHVVSICSMFLADSLGGQLVWLLNWKWIFIFTCSSHVITLLVLFAIKDKHTKYLEKNEIKIFKELKLEFKHKKELYYFISIFALLQSSVSIMFIYGQVIFENLSQTPLSISLIYAFTSAFGGGVLLFLSFIKKLNWYKLTSIFILVSLVLISFFTTKNIYFFVVIFVTLNTTLILFYVHLMNKVNELILSSIRASFISIMSGVSSMLMIGFQILFLIYKDFKIVQSSIFIFLIISFSLATFLYLIYLVKCSKDIDQKIKGLLLLKEKYGKLNSKKMVKKLSSIEESLSLLEKTKLLAEEQEEI
ncbi:MFS transporter [Spiroplasma chinense]|uniref:MFS transporter n=1 Tax=Spiroplasma chinense TaxID=216932 RepID=A0A5B9Y2E2_9MOLU|nr:MFS transporter [Spiroplasma chinense]QEH61238.1 MFS transporter [Spiroplasma chinense]